MLSLRPSVARLSGIVGVFAVDDADDTLLTLA